MPDENTRQRRYEKCNFRARKSAYHDGIPVRVRLRAVSVQHTGGSDTADACILCHIYSGGGGSLGMPVFSGFEGGIGKLTGPTGGYIVGFFILALSASSIIGVLGRRKWSFPFAMTVGTLLLYAFGTAWYSIYTGIGFAESAAACVLPFLLPDAVKITAASVIGISLDSRRALSRYLRRERRDDRRD